jgi:hypothetical protein
MRFLRLAVLALGHMSPHRRLKDNCAAIVVPGGKAMSPAADASCHLMRQAAQMRAHDKA